MKIAILGSRGYPSTYGGYETLVRYLAKSLVHWGHDVTVYGRMRRDGRRKWTTDNVRCIATPGRDSKRLSTLSFGMTSCLDAAARGYDAAIALNIANGFWLPLLRARGVPVALNTDGIEWERGKWGKVAQNIFRAGAWASAHFATELIADSQAIAAIWSKQFSVSSTYVPYGAPVVRNTSKDRLAHLNIVPDRYVLIVARLAPENNVDLMLDALERIPSLPPVVIVGSANYPSPIEDRLRRLVDQHSHFHWLGHIEDQELLMALWAHCGAYVHGHSVGGTNPGLLQALGTGAPTLALDTPFNKEVIRRRSQLFPHDARVLAENIAATLASDQRRLEMREHGWQTISERYSWHSVCASYLAVLERMAGLSPTPPDQLPTVDFTEYTPRADEASLV